MLFLSEQHDAVVLQRDHIAHPRSDGTLADPAALVRAADNGQFHLLLRLFSAGWQNVTLLQGDVLKFDADALVSAGGRCEVDCLHVFLGLSAFPAWRRAAERLWSLLRPGGRLVAVDVHAARPGFQGRMVNLTARADISRRFWEPFEALAEDFAIEALPSLRSHGGELRLLRGRKPSDDA